jgi:ComF family protein
MAADDAVPFVAAYRYQGPVAHALVHRLKYAGAIHLAAPFARALASAWREAGWSTEVALVPVPLSRARRRERGYNQAALLASELGHGLGVPVLDLLVRVRGARSQTGFGRIARRTRVSGTFAAGSATPYLPLVLVDDVRTTGATLEACRSALARAGHHVAGTASVFVTPKRHP